jgi:hypothetical protein
VPGLQIPPFEQRFRTALVTAGRESEWSTISQAGGTTNADYERPDNAASTEDSVSEGQSLEINFRPNRNWDIAFAIDRLENVKTNVGGEIGEFLAIRAPFYKKYFDEGLTLDGTYATPYVTTNTRLLSTNFADNVAVNYVNQLLNEGITNRGLSEYTARLVARYKFLEGRLKGVNIGVNLRWEDGKSIGYSEIPVTFNFGGLTNYPGKSSDISSPYTGDPELTGGMFVTYSRKIWDNRVNWRVQLNAQNLFSKTGLRVFAVNPDGSPVWARFPNQAFELTNTFEF